MLYCWMFNAKHFLFKQGENNMAMRHFNAVFWTENLKKIKNKSKFVYILKLLV
jgi:hypothetical protein